MEQGLRISTAVGFCWAKEKEWTLAREQSDRAISQLQAAISLLLTASNTKRLSMLRTLFYNETLYIVLNKSRGIRLEQGMKAAVLDMETGSVMGVFEITEEQRGEWRAKSVGTVDAVWLGYVRQSGNNEPPPNTITLVFQTGATND